MRERITEAVKTAMKSGEKQRLSTLRLIQAAIKDRDIASRVDAKGQSTGQDKAGDGELLQLLQKMIKQRRESATVYQDAGRSELAEQEIAEIAVIEEFLPKQMTETETEAAVSEVVSEIGASGLKDMGRTMAALKERFAARWISARRARWLKLRSIDTHYRPPASPVGPARTEVLGLCAKMSLANRRSAACLLAF